MDMGLKILIVNKFIMSMFFHQIDFIVIIFSTSFFLNILFFLLEFFQIR